MNKLLPALFLVIVFSFCNVIAGAQEIKPLPETRGCATPVPGDAWETWFSAKVSEFKKKRALQKVQIVNYSIPIIVHILHNGDNVGSNENISYAQVESQIALLNADYAGTNADNANVPAVFQSVKGGNTGIQFCLAKVDVNGVTLAEPGVERINWQTKGWTDPNSFTDKELFSNYFNGTIKPQSIWDPKQYLNVWIASMNNSGLLGYASFPAGSGLSGIPGVETANTCGLVINQRAWGNIGTAALAPYNKGRTATHEIGHWLGLRHIWGDDNCATDYCTDTPPAAAANTGCPSHPYHVGLCSGNTTGEMFMNYMDYSNDACTYTFTAEQVTRMQTAMANGTFRTTLATSIAACTPSSTPLYCSGTTTLTTASGLFSDGSDGLNYKNNANCKWIISPPGATGVTLTFTSFATEAFYDSVYVYDGLNEAAPLLLKWTGNSIPPVVVGTSGTLYVKFVADSDGTDAGWSASYTSSSSSVYTFTGNGSWSTASNWLNNKVQPNPVPTGIEVIIDPVAGGECIYSGTVTFANGSILTIKPGKKLTVNGNLIMQ